jgi:hypothetical protein
LYFRVVAFVHPWFYFLCVASEAAAADQDHQQ